MAGRDRRVIEEDLANVEFETSEDVDVVPTFDSMKLREDLLRGVYAYGKPNFPSFHIRYLNQIVKLHNHINDTWTNFVFSQFYYQILSVVI